MVRRAFITIVAAALVTAPRTVVAQPARVARVGWLTIEPVQERLDAFRQGLRELGYVEPRDVLIEDRYAHGRAERLKDLAAELVQLKLDALVTVGTPATRAAQ